MDAIVPDLLTTPSLNFHKFRLAIHAKAGAIAYVDSPFGALPALLTEAEWRLLPGNDILVEGQPNIVADRPLFEEPAAPAHNAGPAIIAIWKKKSDDYRITYEHLRLFKAAIISSIDPHDLLILSDPLLGLLNVSLRQIWQHVTDLYGTLTAADFTSLRQQLVQPMSPSTTVQAHIGIHRHIHQQFEASNQTISNVDKCYYLKYSVQTHPDVKIALDSYFVVNPAVAQQTFVSMSTHLIAQQANFAPTAAAMGYTANATAELVPNNLDQLCASPAFAALILKTVQAALPSGRDRARRPRTSTTLPASAALTSPSDRPRAYCHSHGYDTHRGTDCRYMLAHPELFTKQHRTATNHTALPGGNVTRL